MDSLGTIFVAKGKSNGYQWEEVGVPLRIGLDLLWHKSKEADTILEKLYHILQTSNADPGEIKSVYRYTGEPALE